MDFRREKLKIRRGYTHIIGCDEVGRGSLAGPVVAAAVVFDLRLKIKDLRDIKDSKLLSAKRRENLSQKIKTCALAWSVAEVPPDIIDRINIHQATLLAMRRVVDSLSGVILRLPKVAEESRPKKEILRASDALGAQDDANRKKLFLFVDGKFPIPGLNFAQQAVIGGDNKVLSIAAASIIAKVYRDSLMRKFHCQYPVYNFARHKGYGTLYHRNTILQCGLSPIHRLSFCENLI